MLGLGVVAAGLLVAADVSRLSYRTIGIGACSTRVNPDICTTTGGDAHSHVLWLIALVVLAFAFGAAVGRSRPAALGLVICGIGVFVIALAIDAPKLDDKRGLDLDYNQVTTHTGPAFPLELIGAGLAVVAGSVALRSKGQGARGQGQGPRSEAAA